MNRRELIKGGVLAGLATAFPFAAGATAAAGRAAPSPAGRARNVVFFAYDGLTFEDLGTARFFAHRHREGKVLTLERLLARGASGCMLPHSLTSVVTDSAAATTAWSTGRKVVNGALAMYPDERPLTTVLELARATGRASGLVTTTRITHATPAGWVAKVPSRNQEDEIAAQYLGFGPEVLLGGGSQHFDAAHRGDGQDLFAGFRAAGYGVVRTAEELRSCNASRLLGTFHHDHVPYEIDRRFQGVPAPTLAEMTAKALEVLDGHGSGFVLQIEAGRVDHANHQNDPGAAVWDILAADAALDVVLAFADRHPDTLVVLASDHGTGSGAVYGVGSRYRNANPSFDRLARHRISYRHLLDVLGPRPESAMLIEAARAHFDVALTADQARRIAETLEQRTTAAHPRAHGSEITASLHWLLTHGTELEPHALNVGYATGAHVAGPVPLAVYGAGAGTAGLGVVDNTELFAWMLNALGITHENPGMSEAEALELTHAEAVSATVLAGM